VFLLELLGLITYSPEIASIIPCPPDVPGSQASIKASEACKTSPMIKGLPDKITLIKGIDLSWPLMVVTTSYSNFENSNFNVFSCSPGAYTF
jgi:hypothetical protein